MSTRTIEMDADQLDATLDRLQAAAEASERLNGTDYVKVTFAKANGIEWLDTPPRLGDEMRLEVVVTVTATGKRLTDDGIQATATLEVTGVTAL